MHKKTQKKFVAGLLLICCLLAGWLLFISPHQQSKHLQHINQADSLLQLTFSDFNIPKDEISTRSTKIDSTFSRITYRIPVSPDFPQSRFHAQLKATFSPYQISLPARVIFPDKDMHIFISYHHTVIRTLKLITERSAKSPGNK